MTLEEIKSALADKDILVGVTGMLKEQGLIVRTSDEEKSFMENYEKNVLPSKIEAGVEEKIKSRVSEFATRIEQDVFESSGIPKNEGEKYYDYQKRIIGELKGKPSDSEQILKDQLKIYQDKTKELSDKLTLAEESKKTEILDFKKKTVIGEAVRNINVSYPANITTEEQKAEYRQMIERTILNDFQSRFTAKESGDDIVFYEGDTPLLDTTTNKYLNPSSIIERNFGVFIAPKQEPRGGLGGEQSKASTVGKMSAEQFDQYASDKGLVLGSKAYAQSYTEMVV